MERYTITLRSSGEQFDCAGDETVLAAMARTHSGPVKCGCHGGGCGVCKMRVLAGPYEAFKRMSAGHVSADERRQGYVLTCCIKPRGNMTLSAGSR